MNGNGNGGEKQSWSEILIALLRGVTPLGVVAIYMAVSGIGDDINRNCNATADLARVTGIIAAVDNDLSTAERANVNRALRSLNTTCDS